MSGIYIPDMEMPSTCVECRLSTAINFKEKPMCDVLVEYMRYGEWLSKRLDNCPLIPVPDHGRLIDANALIRNQPYGEKPQTNADRIRAMTDEELANLIGTHDCLDCPLNSKDDWCAGAAGSCRGNVLEWLKAPVEVDE